MPLNPEVAKSQPLQVLFPPYLPFGDEGIERIEKALRKMNEHSELENATLRAELMRLRSALKNGTDVLMNDCDVLDELDPESIEF